MKARERVPPSRGSRLLPRRPSARRYQHLWHNDVCGLDWGGWRGGCKYDSNPSATATAEDFALASEVLDAFDVVFVMEWLYSPTYKDFVARALFGVPAFPVAWKNSRLRRSGPEWRPQPAEIADVLRHQERFDVALVDRAVSRRCADVRAWLRTTAGAPLGSDPPCFAAAGGVG